MENLKKKRHKCHYCGSVRYEFFMFRLNPSRVQTVSQFGNDLKCWACRYCITNKQVRKRPENLQF